MGGEKRNRRALRGDSAERERFELSIRFYTVWRFSKPLVSATHPPLQVVRTINIAIPALIFNPSRS